MKTYDLFFYTAKATDKRDPAHVKTWTTYKASMEGYTFDVVISDDCIKKLNKEQCSEIKKLFMSGMDAVKIAKKYNITEATVYKAIASSLL